MKTKLLSIIIFLVYTNSFGKPPYTITKADLIAQFSTENNSNRIYCYNKEGKKVWLHYTEYTHLIVKLKNNNKKKIILQTLRYQNNVIEGLPYHPWGPPHIKVNCNLDEIESLKIGLIKFENESPYINYDSCKVISKLKNDSIKKAYKSRDRLSLLLTTNIKSKHDTISIFEGACYNFTFRDKNKTEYGVVSKITQDSIYISSTLNRKLASANNKDYQIFQYSINDIAELQLLKSGGFGFKIISTDQYQIRPQKIDEENLICPAWYAINPTNGEIHFYRSWLTERGYKGITEFEGKPIWYEGEITE